jgi:hypothetical protein
MIEEATKAKEGLKDALESEKGNLAQLREKVRSLSVVQLGYRQCYAVAPVATDGGENRFTFEPINVEIVRVVDSDERIYFDNFLPLSADHVELGNRLFSEIPCLRLLCDRLGTSHWSDLSYLFGKRKQELDEVGVDDARQFVKVIRDILEWAVLLEIAWEGVRGRFLLIRDGLLRTKFIKREVFPQLAEQFRLAHREKGTMIVGVAKQSKALNYLSLALALEGTFDVESPCFTEIPGELERECYRWAGTWMEGQCFGRLHLAKLAAGRNTAVFPIDVPEWLMASRKEVLEYLAETAKASFPTVGYPYPLIKAHEYANISGFEMSLLEKLIVDAAADLVCEAEKERIIRHITLGRGMARGGTRGGQ